MLAQTKKLVEQEKQLTEHSRVIGELQKQQTDQEEQVSNLNRKITEYDQKFADIATRIDRICAVSNTDTMTSLSVEETHGPLSYDKDTEKRSVNYIVRQRQKRHRATDNVATGDSERPRNSRSMSPKRTKISRT